MLEPGVFGGRVHPPGGLQLVDSAQPLHPGMVDDFPLRDTVNRQALSRSEGNVAVDRIVTQILKMIGPHVGDYRPTGAKRTGGDVGPPIAAFLRRRPPAGEQSRATSDGQIDGRQPAL